MTQKFREAQVEFYIHYLEKMHLMCYKAPYVPLPIKWFKRLRSGTFYTGLKKRMIRELSRPIKGGDK